MPDMLRFWWPEKRLQRKARSDLSFTFDRETMGMVVRGQVIYSFADSLQHENQLVIFREMFNPVYRGDVRTFTHFYHGMSRSNAMPAETQRPRVLHCHKW
jgi:hypothetical protein